MSVLRVGLPMFVARNGGPTLLGEAAAFPGVYKANFAGEPLTEAAQKKYKRDHKSQLGRKPAAKKKWKAKLAWRGTGKGFAKTTPRHPGYMIQPSVDGSTYYVTFMPTANEDDGTAVKPGRTMAEAKQHAEMDAARRTLNARLDAPSTPRRKAAKTPAFKWSSYRQGRKITSYAVLSPPKAAALGYAVKLRENGKWYLTYGQGMFRRPLGDFDTAAAAKKAAREHMLGQVPKAKPRSAREQGRALSDALGRHRGNTATNLDRATREKLKNL